MTFPFLFAAFGHSLFMLFLTGVATFLILLVLVQRGRGGGLAGALGGMGGSSAFGAKAGDVFTRVTIVAASIWIFLCILATKLTPSEEGLLNTNVSGPTSSISAPADSAAAGDEGPATQTGSEAKTDAESDSGTEAETTAGPEAESNETAAGGDAEETAEKSVE